MNTNKNPKKLVNINNKDKYQELFLFIDTI